MPNALWILSARSFAFALSTLLRTLLFTLALNWSRIKACFSCAAVSSSFLRLLRLASMAAFSFEFWASASITNWSLRVFSNYSICFIKRWRSSSFKAPSMLFLIISRCFSISRLLTSFSFSIYLRHWATALSSDETFPRPASSLASASFNFDSRPSCGVILSSPSSTCWF